MNRFKMLVLIVGLLSNYSGLFAMEDGMVPRGIRVLMLQAVASGLGKTNVVKVLSHCVAEDSNKKYRSTMEDEHDVQLFPDEDQAFFGVYDGHGGKQVATHVKQRLVSNIRQAYATSNDPEQALITAFSQTDSSLEVSRVRAYSSGSTAAVAWINGHNLHVAHVGDARVLLFDKEGRVLHVTKDHKPNSDDEKKRIQEAGLRIEFYDGCWRVDGLAVSRSFGDFGIFGKNPREKLILSEPIVTSLQLTGDEAYMVIACDGLWDVMDEHLGQDNDAKGQSSQVARFIFEQVKNGIEPHQLAQALVNEALKLDTADNLTAIVVKF
ncbi:MAG: protein serine/threonine phosphatase 2C family protein [Epsilonproteobacteria bacterium]|nr:protein serine/threonine phosphatase 2C family protein [Campylobacterota bacterium]